MAAGNLYDGVEVATEPESKIVAVRVPTAERAAFKAACKANGMSMSQALALLVPLATRDLLAKAKAKANG